MDQLQEEGPGLISFARVVDRQTSDTSEVVVLASRNGATQYSSRYSATPDEPMACFRTARTRLSRVGMAYELPCLLRHLPCRVRDVSPSRKLNVE